MIGVAAMLLISLHRAIGEVAPQAADPVSRGRNLADVWCRECHNMSSMFRGGDAPHFAAVANMPSTTELSLRVFLQTSHKTMPNIILKRDDMDDIVAYILSLKRE